MKDKGRVTTTSRNLIEDHEVKADARPGVAKLTAEKTVKYHKKTARQAQTTSPISIRTELTMTTN